MTHILRLPGREITSGSQGEAIASVKRTSRVNRGESLCFGSVCPDMLEVTLLQPETPIAPGDKLELLDGERTLLGTFYCQSAELSGTAAGITAYDSLYLLEKDVTEWLSGLDCWPYTLEDFAHSVCRECGVTLSEDPIPNGGWVIEKFTGNTTGRTLLGFVAEVAGCFVQADAEGVAHFRWYTPKAIAEPVCFSKKMQDFVTAPADKVQIQLTGQDIGVIYPDTEGENTYQVTGNPLLTGEVLPIAQSLYEKLQGIAYTPGVLRVAECGLQAGDVFTFQGQAFYVMQTVKSAEGLELSCFGQKTFGSVAVRNQEKFSALSGKVLELTAKVEGLLAENRDLAGNLARLSLNLEGISGQVAAQSGETTRLRQSISQMNQKADSISATVSQVVENGVSRVENAFGVTLDGSSFTIHRQDSQVTNRLNEQGMYVLRAEGSEWETAMLRADVDGVLATDVTVGNYLKVGDHTRFESYGTGRTACYYC